MGSSHLHVEMKSTILLHFASSMTFYPFSDTAVPPLIAVRTCIRQWPSAFWARWPDKHQQSRTGEITIEKQTSKSGLMLASNEWKPVTLDKGDFVQVSCFQREKARWCVCVDKSGQAMLDWIEVEVKMCSFFRGVRQASYTDGRRKPLLYVSYGASWRCPRWNTRSRWIVNRSVGKSASQSVGQSVNQYWT